MSAIAVRTAARVSARTSVEFWSTRETVDFDTPALAATSRMVGRRVMGRVLPLDAMERQKMHHASGGKVRVGQKTGLIGEAENLGKIGDFA